MRKDQYTRSLENEVARLRASETSLLNEVQHLRNALQKLGGRLDDRGIQGDLTTDLSSGEDERWPDARLVHHQHLTASYHTGEQPRLNVCLESPFGGLSPFGTEPLQESWLPTWQDDYHSPPLGKDHRDLSVPPASPQSSLRLGDLDPTAVGMEFVLA